MPNGQYPRLRPQRKIIDVANRMGNTGIAGQQGTTRTIYDSLPLDGRTSFRFFENASTRQFPLTNQNAEGGKLGVGETLAIQRGYLSVTTVDNQDPNIVTGVNTIASFALSAVTAGELNVEIANSQVIKKLSMRSFDPRFNKSSNHQDDQNFEFDTDIVINPLLEFVFNLRTANYVVIPNSYLTLTIEGVGSIIAPRTTM